MMKVNTSSMALWVIDRAIQAYRAAGVRKTMFLPHLGKCTYVKAGRRAA
ncbi:MAG TPA: hypothetical protein VEY51_05170 [Chondromyces sp.]|nr:hypothetical protein [Chondromyces sp.]